MRIRENFLGGTLSSSLSDVGTTLTSAVLTDFPQVDSPDYMAIVVDPLGSGGDPEIMYITAHTGGATPLTTATVLRGQEGTVAREHAANVRFTHAPTINDFREVKQIENPRIYSEAYGPDEGYDEEFNNSGATSPPTGWSWWNQGTATYSENFSHGTIYESTPGTNLRGIDRLIPSEEVWTAEAAMSSGISSNVSGDNIFFGLYVRDNAGANVMIRRASTSGVIVTRSANASFGSAANYSSAIGTTGSLSAFRIVRNSATSMDFWYSADGGVSWARIDAARNISAHITPTRIGLLSYSNVASLPISYSVDWFRVRS